MSAVFLCVLAAVCPCSRRVAALQSKAVALPETCCHGNRRLALLTPGGPLKDRKGMATRRWYAHGIVLQAVSLLHWMITFKFLGMLLWHSRYCVQLCGSKQIVAGA